MFNLMPSVLRRWLDDLSLGAWRGRPAAASRRSGQRPRSTLVRARGQDPLHGLAAWEATLDRHARTPDVDLLDRDTRRGQRHVGIWRTVCQPVAEHESVRRFGLQDLPVPAVPVALGPDHPVLDATA